VPGALALAAWVLYVLSVAVFYFPDYPASVWPIGGCGLLACAWVGLNLARWRLAVVLASCVYLLFYAVRVLRMAALTSGFEISSLLTTLLFYYKSSWTVTIAMLQEKGVASSLMHGYIEYAMPVLSLALIALALLYRRRPTR
jgi:hypothetical protein